MTITLNDMSMLVYLSIVGQFCYNVPLDFVDVVETLMDLLDTMTILELRQCRGPHVGVSWLRDLYNECCENP